ncbi:MAG TPA: hypothetical protein DGG95_10135 [Cytophagales bacterium]|jgi:hypothetical protein|nr:hypothetical protein [Cytophagales bacterium]
MAIGFFTQGIEFTLPHPPIPQRTILLLCNVIKKAWHLLLKHPPDSFILHSANEDTIIQMLVEIIENRLRKNGEVDGFDCARFGKVIREPKITNFNKKHPDKMPDIFFDLKREQYSVLSDQDGLFVECKPVDNDHPILSCYCQKGLVRFVNGDYAWAMQDALMVGYVSGHYPFEKLASILEDRKSAILKTKSHFSADKYSIYHSSHERNFEWLENHGQACQISVAHLWLSL